MSSEPLERPAGTGGTPGPFEERIRELFFHRHFPSDTLLSGRAPTLPPYPCLTIHSSEDEEDDRRLIAFPFMESEMRAIYAQFPSLAPIADNHTEEPHCIESTHFTLGNPDWDPALQALAQERAADLGVRQQDKVVAVLSHLVVIRPTDGSVPIRSHQPDPQEFAILVVQMPSVYEREGHAGEPNTAFQRHHCHVVCMVAISQLSLVSTPLSAGVALMVVYSLRWTGDQPLSTDILFNPNGPFESIVAEYQGETMALQFDTHYRPRQAQQATDDRFVDKLWNAQQLYGLPGRKRRFDLAILHRKRKREEEGFEGRWVLFEESELFQCYSYPEGDIMFPEINMDFLVSNGCSLEKGDSRGYARQITIRRDAFLLILPACRSIAQRREIHSDDVVADWAFESMEEDDFPPDEREELFLEMLEFGLHRKDEERMAELLMHVSRDARVAWLASTSLDYVVEHAQLFDFWNDEECRAKILPLLFSSDDVVDVTDMLDAITPKEAEPAQIEAIQTWAQKCLDNFVTQAGHDAVGGQSLVNLCLQTREPEENLRRYVTAGCHCHPELSWFHPLDYGIMRMADSSRSMYLPLRPHLFDVYAQVVSQCDGEDFVCEEVVYFLHQAIELPNGRELCGPAMNRLLDASQVPTDVRQSLIESCIHLPLPRLSELCQLQMTLLREQHRQLRVLPWRMPLAHVRHMGRTTDMSVESVNEFLHSDQRVLCIPVPDGRGFGLHGQKFSVTYQHPNPTTIQVTKTEDVYQSPDIRWTASNLGVMKQWSTGIL